MKHFRGVSDLRLWSDCRGEEHFRGVSDKRGSQENSPQKHFRGVSDLRLSPENHNEKPFRGVSDKRGSPGNLPQKHFRGVSDLRVFRSKLSYKVDIGFMKYGKSDTPILRFLGTGERISCPANKTQGENAGNAQRTGIARGI